MNNVILFEELGILEDCTTIAKILGWLLNPKESHNLKSSFLEDFLLLANYKIVPCDDVTVETNHGAIDILINTKDRVFAIQCWDLDTDKPREKADLENITDKKIIYVPLNVAPHNWRNSSHRKSIEYVEIAEILPQNLNADYQTVINKCCEIIQEKCASVKMFAHSSDSSKEEIEKYKELNKYGRIIMRIAKYFHLEFSSKIYNCKYRQYYVCSDNVSLLFDCKKDYLFAKIELRNNFPNIFFNTPVIAKASENFKSKILEQAQSMGLNVKTNNNEIILQEIELMTDKEKTFEELIEIINQSQILENFQKLCLFCIQ